MNLVSFALSDIGRTRKSNQDAVGCFPELGLFLLADGMGGLDRGERASQLAIETISEHWRRGLAGGPGASVALLAEAIDAANRRIREEAAPQNSGRRTLMSGTTIVAFWVEDSPDLAHWAHLGDSRLYRARRGRLELLTSDHTIAGSAHTSLETIPLDLPHTNLLTHALGLSEVASPVIAKNALATGDTFLLCSDGISGALAPGELVTHLDSPDSVESIAHRLVEAALAAGGDDNASVVVVRGEPSPEK